MTDHRAAYDEDRLPWLEEVDDEDGPRGMSGRRMLAAFLLVVLAAAIVWGTLFWLGRESGGEAAGAPELILAEPGPYKVKPADPGGLDVAGESETAFQTSAGEDTDANLDLDAAPEPPVVRPAPKPAPTPAADPPAAAEPVAPTPAPAGGKGSVIQLGFFDNAAQAERAWTSLSSRFPTVAAMGKIVVPYKTGFRLRAGAGSPAAAKQACQALVVAGEKCFVAN
ncbi:SPOR domain-containing protein [Sphingomonas sp.]|uniref:SPOR domain-containing protein n=1 Tax=Sphingomonas sp. TaxID=28214 RepID=UPI00286DC36E|nr:SPOR domain-containing protein [Sphingomonas sp.]